MLAEGCHSMSPSSTSCWSSRLWKIHLIWDSRNKCWSEPRPRYTLEYDLDIGFSFHRRSRSDLDLFLSLPPNNLRLKGQSRKLKYVTLVELLGSLPVFLQTHWTQPSVSLNRSSTRSTWAHDLPAHNSRGKKAYEAASSTSQDVSYVVKSRELGITFLRAKSFKEYYTRTHGDSKRRYPRFTAT